MNINRLSFVSAAILLFLSVMAIAEVANAESSAPIEVVTKKDDLEEIQLKSRLEDRLARDIQAYLGHGRFYY